MCALLRDLGVVGFPASHFHDPSFQKWLENYKLDPRKLTTTKGALNAIFKAAFEFGKGETDIFGLRLQGHSLNYLKQQLEVLYPSLTSDRSRIEKAFGKTLFIYLTRENNLEQAISYVKAQQTGLWHMAPDGTELERLSTPSPAFYDADAIGKQLTQFEKMDRDWEDWFETEKIEPLPITYEELSSHPQTVLERILKSLGVDSEPPQLLELPVAKLADSTNQDWANQFKNMRRELKI